MNDSETIQVLAEENGKLKQKLSSVELSLRSLNQDFVQLKRKKILGEWLAKVVAVTFSLVVAVAIIFPLYMMIFHAKDGDCYVESVQLSAEQDVVGQGTRLRRRVSWIRDRKLGVFNTYKEALERAKELGCKIR